MSLEKAIKKLTLAISSKKPKIAPIFERPTPSPGFDPFGYPLGDCPTSYGYFSPASLQPGTCCYATQPNGQCFMQCKDHNGMVQNATPVGTGPCVREGLFAPTYQ